MNKETIEAIQQALTPIAEKIGQGAAFGWEVVVRQQYVEAFGGLILFAFLAPIVVWLFYWAAYVSRSAEGPFFARVAAIALSIGSAYMLYNFIARLINPEFYALRFFMALVQ